MVTTRKGAHKSHLDSEEIHLSIYHSDEVPSHRSILTHVILTVAKRLFLFFFFCTVPFGVLVRD